MTHDLTSMIGFQPAGFRVGDVFVIAGTSQQNGMAEICRVTAILGESEIRFERLPRLDTWWDWAAFWLLVTMIATAAAVTL